MIVWWLRVGMGMLALVLLTACAAGGETPSAQLEFRAASEIGADQQLHITLEIHNAGAQSFGGDQDLGAVMQLVDSSGTVRAEVNVAQLGSLAAGASAWPATWQGHLDAGRYTLRWGSSGYSGASETELVITQQEGELFMGTEETSVAVPATPSETPTAGATDTPTAKAPSAATPTSGAAATDTPTSSTQTSGTPEAAAPSGDAANVDPTATPLIAMARQDLSERLGVASDTIVLVAVEPETFSDSSLGVPQPGQMYLQVITPGYVIYLQADGVTYTYNAGANHVVPADGEG